VEALAMTNMPLLSQRNHQCEAFGEVNALAC
jgi:hypothetical protein